MCLKQKSDNTKNEIVELVDLCNDQRGLPNAFIRDVSTAPELAVVVTNDQQFQVIYKFCAIDHCWSIFGVDDTFNIFSYSITISIYHHPLLYNVNLNVHPVLFVPTLIHSNQPLGSYFSLSTVMFRLKPELPNLGAFGTDRKKISLKQ